MSQDKDLKLRGHSAADVWDFENAFYWFSQASRVHKLMAHYDLYQKIIELLGDVFEFAVYKVVLLLRVALFRDKLENEIDRKVVGFDAL